MAEGVRIRLVEGRRLTHGQPYMVVVRDLSRRNPDLPSRKSPCGACGLPSPGHEGYRTKHIRVDADGYTIVAQEFWADLQRFIDNGGFELANPVPEPPTQGLTIGPDGKGKIELIHKVQRPIMSKKGK